jgi:3-hydroxybutyryl-CoA dehydrogenase
LNMKIAVLGTPNRIKELRCIIDSKHELIEVKNKQFVGYDLIIDLEFDNYQDRLHDYAHLEGMLIIVGAVKSQLEAQMHQYPHRILCTLIGMNTLPTFINRSLIELTTVQEEDKAKIYKTIQDLNWEVRWVESRVGMVTPRIIFMIINEAYYTLQEGTASRSDIDTGMKLGTAYPMGPFEWCNKVGLKNVYETLEAVYNDTKDERYKICPLLKTEYLKERASYRARA